MHVACVKGLVNSHLTSAARVHDAHADRMCARRHRTSFRKSYGWGYAVVSPAAGVAPSRKDGAWRFEVVVEAATGTHSPALTSVRACPHTYIALVPACTTCTRCTQLRFACHLSRELTRSLAHITNPHPRSVRTHSHDLTRTRTRPLA
jgi:hypothetical protein